MNSIKYLSCPFKKIILILMCVAGVVPIYAQRNILNSPSRKLQIAEYAISNLYVDPVNESKVVEAAIRAMLEDLDPHSTYSTSEEVQLLNEPLKGNFDGIGVQFNMSTDTLFVIQTISGGPSEKVGIMAGDKIVEVNDTLIAGVKMPIEDVKRRLRGPKGTKVEVKVIRRGAKDLLSFTIKRDKIPMYSIDAAYMIDKRIGYVKISRFAATTGKEFVEALEQLKRKGMKKLILDLQGNGGGYLSSAIDVADQVLSKNEQIVYTVGNKSPYSGFTANGKGIFKKGELIVLVDEFTASASEIVTGAIQDWDRGYVVGRRSFGKGLVQRPIELPDGSMIRLTVSRYYTPSGRCIQKPYDNIKDYSMDLIERYNKGEMASADSIHFPDSLQFKTKKLGRTVYGGGGIMPDYFVPIDTTMYSDYYLQLRNKGALLRVNINLIDLHRNEWLKKYKTFEQFEQKFEVGNDILGLLREEGEQAGIAFDEKGYQRALPLLKVQLKALIARDLWNMNEYFQISNKLDRSVVKAVELMNHNDASY